MRKLWAPGVTPRIVYCPSWLVIADTCWVMPWTRAPASGWPLASSVALPATLPCWAAAVPPISPIASQATALTRRSTGVRMDFPRWGVGRRRAEQGGTRGFVAGDRSGHGHARLSGPWQSSVRGERDGCRTQGIEEESSDPILSATLESARSGV